MNDSNNRFANILRQESRWVRTENGADALDDTGSALLSMFASMGAMRSRSAAEIRLSFQTAWKEDPLGALRCLFYLRDVRGGQGERRVFRVLLPCLASISPEALQKNLPLVPEYGRWDDLYALIGTPLEPAMWQLVKEQLAQDTASMDAGEPCSLLAKWLKKADASSQKTRQLGIYTAQKLGMSVYGYKRLSNRLRRHIDVTEQRMSAGEWASIQYGAVPSRAMMNYRNAFSRHDKERFAEYLTQVGEGAQRIHSGTLYPYDIAEKILYGGEENAVLEAQWANLPNYVEDGCTALVMADVSGSMEGRPMATSVGLALYFAERSQGPFQNLFLTFSHNPQVVEIKGSSITEKLQLISKTEWGFNTNLEAALLRILDLAVTHHCSQDELPKSLIIISDMEFDACARQPHRQLFYHYAEERFQEKGYVTPNIVFWNVNSRHTLFHADQHQRGVQLLSGQSTSSFQNLTASIGRTPVEMMYQVLNSERYQAVTL